MEFLWNRNEESGKIELLPIFKGQGLGMEFNDVEKP